MRASDRQSQRAFPRTREAARDHDGRRGAELPRAQTSESHTGLVTGVQRGVRAEDLLTRSPVTFRGSPRECVTGRSVLITGAAGSIGSALAHEAVAAGVEQLTLLDSNESGLFDLSVELKDTASVGATRLDVLVANVTEGRRLCRQFKDIRPAIVLHAAALKHVPLMEKHIEAAVVVNVIGTYNVCAAAEAAGCDRVVFLSTDKAVDPVNVMGATKRVGEMIVQAFSSSSTTSFCSVRPGNVLGSRGSLVPILERQIRKGGPVTITRPDATRHFLSMAEAINLIFETCGRAQTGETFILDTGAPIAVLDLAHALILARGLRPGEDIVIREIGLRPGEKLHEALTARTEVLLPTRHPAVGRLVSRQGGQYTRDEIDRIIQEFSALSEAGSTEELTLKLFAVARSDTLPSGQRRGLQRPTLTRGGLKELQIVLVQRIHC